VLIIIRNKTNYDVFFLVGTIVITYFFFKMLVIFSIVYDLESCTHLKWQLTVNNFYSPFYIFLGNAILLFIWFSIQSRQLLIRSFKSAIPFIFIGLVFFYFWFRGFYGLWWLFELERNNINKKEFIELTGGFSGNMHPIDYNTKINETYGCKL